MSLVSTVRPRAIANGMPPAPPIPDHEGLSVEQLTVTFGHRGEQLRTVLGVDLTLRPGETLVLLGESGCGKSVTARALMRLHGRTATVGGRVLLDGVDLLALDENEMRARRGREIAFVPQDSSASLDPLRRVGAQLAEVLRVHGLVPDKKAAVARAEECLRWVGIGDPRRVARSFAHELSGGMRQRVLIALAIACEPRILVADEPTTALDVTIQAQVLELFERLQSETGMGVLMVTHDVGVARQVADRVAVMYAGRVVEDGPAVDVLDRPAHHYTGGLLGALPARGVARGHLVAITGRPPTPAEITEDKCAFAPRCQYANDTCRSVLPTLEEFTPARHSACAPGIAALLHAGDLEDAVSTVPIEERT
jgi:oligopeptide/dipeptide ABC transporter ATP-binding protein